MNYTGIDWHKKYSVCYTVDEKGQRLAERKIEGNTAAGFAAYFGSLPEPSAVVPGASAPADKLYYTRDHLGSIRAIINSSGVLEESYVYDPWGKMTAYDAAGQPKTPIASGQAANELKTSFGYTGHYRHQPSGLHLAMFRAYDADLRRWLSRDPIENAESLEGPNLYAYVANDPGNLIDLLGKDAIDAAFWQATKWWWSAQIAGGLIAQIGHQLAVQNACDQLCPGEETYIQTPLTRVLSLAFVAFLPGRPFNIRIWKDQFGDCYEDWGKWGAPEPSPLY